MINGGSGRNVIPNHAVIKFETRGQSQKINDYMNMRAEQIVSAAAAMYNVETRMACVGRARSFELLDEVFASQIYSLAKEFGGFDSIIEYADLNASEDCTSFMTRVCELGGKAAYLLIGTDLADKHHTPNFDFDEDSMTAAAAFYAFLAIKFAK